MPFFGGTTARLKPIRQDGDGWRLDVLLSRQNQGKDRGSSGRGDDPADRSAWADSPARSLKAPKRWGLPPCMREKSVRLWDAGRSDGGREPVSPPVAQEAAHQPGTRPPGGWGVDGAAPGDRLAGVGPAGREADRVVGRSGPASGGERQVAWLGLHSRWPSTSSHEAVHVGVQRAVAGAAEVAAV